MTCEKYGFAKLFSTFAYYMRYPHVFTIVPKTAMTSVTRDDWQVPRVALATNTILISVSQCRSSLQNADLIILQLEIKTNFFNKKFSMQSRINDMTVHVLTRSLCMHKMEIVGRSILYEIWAFILFYIIYCNLLQRVFEFIII